MASLADRKLSTQPPEKVINPSSLLHVGGDLMQKQNMIWKTEARCLIPREKHQLRERDEKSPEKSSQVMFGAGREGK